MILSNKLSLAAFVLALFLSPLAQADVEIGELCDQPLNEFTFKSFAYDHSDVEVFYVYNKPPTCEAVENAVEVLQVSSIVTSLTGIAAACTGVGAPFTVMTQMTALGLRFLAIKAKRLPCRQADNLNTLETRLQTDREFRESFKQELKYEICNDLEEAGVSCNPPMIDFELKQQDSYI